jgi:hypothetical protein
MSFYLHEVPGRLRIKTPDLKRNPGKARILQRRLNALAGVVSASVNAVTGSLLVHYDPEIVRSEAILSYASRELGVQLSNLAPNEASMDGAFGKMGQQVSKALLVFALDRALQGSPLSILTAFI